MKHPIILPLLLISILFACKREGQPILETQVWHKITLDFAGPRSSESAEENPFLDYRLNVTFQKGDTLMTVPGFYSADGHAAETGAEEGNLWQVRFRPIATGQWTYTASFQKGKDIAISDDPDAGEKTSFDGQTGKINVIASDKQGRDFRAKGSLQYTGERYLQFAGTKEWFLKGGADSPENLLGYIDFDGTYKGSSPETRSGEAENKATLHTYAPHATDWKTGHPSWRSGKGKNLIGALNYLASKGINSVYFLTMNIEGDGKDVWPYTAYEERERFDCSKLDQWEIVFDHMDSLGLMQHMVLQETENEKLLDEGDTRYHRKLYYREMIARFGHHPAVTWNMGEENGPANFSPNGQTTAQQKAMVQYMKEHDPYRHYVVIHTHSSPKVRHDMFNKLLGDQNLDGPSIQIHSMFDAHEETLHWIDASKKAGKSWVVNIDEIGPANRGVDPDDRVDNNQDTARTEVLWGNLMAGGGGAEWYFGYLNHDNDLGCEDWRSRDRMWDYTRYGLSFFQQYLPFREMENRDELLTGGKAWCLAKQGEIYALYLPHGGTCSLDLSGDEGTYSMQWYNPREGGALQDGVVKEVEGGKVQLIGPPPGSPDHDWAILLRKK